MFSKILGKKDTVKTQENQDIINKIATMNLTDMKTYINNKMVGLESNEEGIIEVMKRLTTKHEKTSKRYIEIDDMDSKIKKAFDLVILLSNHERLTVTAVELIHAFIALYKDVIAKFDKDNKEIYASKLKTALSQAISNIDKASALQRRNSVLGK